MLLYISIFLAGCSFGILIYWMINIFTIKEYENSRITNEQLEFLNTHITNFVCQQEIFNIMNKSTEEHGYISKKYYRQILEEIKKMGVIHKGRFNNMIVH